MAINYDMLVGRHACWHGVRVVNSQYGGQRTGRRQITIPRSPPPKRPSHKSIDGGLNSTVMETASCHCVCATQTQTSPLPVSGQNRRRRSGTDIPLMLNYGKTFVAHPTRHGLDCAHVVWLCLAGYVERSWTNVQFASLDLSQQPMGGHLSGKDHAYSHRLILHLI